MKCQFLSNGLAIGYNQIVKPCCAFKTTEEYIKQNHISQVDLSTWNKSDYIVKAEKILADGDWPEGCSACKSIESMNRGDSMRLNAQQSYGDYSESDLTLEIRPGSTCNFACQTCWPEASSRVRDFYHKAKLIDITDLNSNALNNFDFLLPVTDRLKSIIILGGEPFYDKSCLRFLNWLVDNHVTSDITMFTNGSHIDFDFLRNHLGKVTLVFSIDAIGRPAEYIRFGTVWQDVYANYLECQQISNVNLRINITTSPYNYPYLNELIKMLCDDWPEVVSFGLAGVTTNTVYMDESVVPMNYRAPIIHQLTQTIDILDTAQIEKYQKINAKQAIQSIIDRLTSMEFNISKFDKFKSFVHAMDTAKHMDISDYCPEVFEMLSSK